MIEFKNVKKHFLLPGKMFEKKYLKAVNDVSFTIEQGTTLAVVGESGCGKTTLAKLLMGLYDLTDGEVLIDGVNLSSYKSVQDKKKLRSKIQMIFQDPFGSLNPAHTIKNIIGRSITLHNSSLSGEQVTDKVVELMELVGLTPARDFMEKHPSQLSGGQRQRIVIARALAVDPSIIVADEPTSMLDVSIGIDIMNLLLELKEKKALTMLYITHNLASARYMADHIAVMYAGNCVEYGAIDEIIREPYHPYTVLLLGSTPEPFREEIVDIYAKEELPDLTSTKECCMFAGRCPKATEKCRTQQPDNIQIGGRQVKCFLYEGEHDRAKALCDIKMYQAEGGEE
ncbi:ABC transporter ATP-binding protein [Ruminococcus gauvreauii]|uniref:ABC transporter ATP-binding protein n=1 Tax=Ruminococcus gauvreauii TaxID=438033 RepID=A0ABY5VL98_9FIRM|nr:ABC transporter ATP-binding protein [Ruminococcus gauvreauii]UWP60803.1 ABC transporter ATP-binding protein [Ruminococcus gauvreauii]